MERQRFREWVDRYLGTWETNDPAAIGALFTDDAVYEPSPDRPVWTGREAIVAEWLARKDTPGTWTFRSEVLGVSGDLGVVRGWTRYTAGTADYSNLWLVRLAPDGRCSHFSEWWAEHRHADGGLRPDT